MRQAIHIFRKDIRSMRIEVGVLLAFAGLYAWVGSDWSVILLEIVAVCVIARAVQTDPVPGDRQFWLTRPYRRSSLAAAKLLFALICVGIPIGMAHVMLLWRAGFSLPDSVPALLTFQVLLFLAGAIPAVALASVTSGILPFLFSTLVLAMGYLAEDLRSPGWLGMLSGTPAAAGWVRNVIAGMVIVCAALFIILRQYRDRSTTASRVTAFAAFHLAAAIFLWLPQSVALAVQQKFSKDAALAAPVTAAPQGLQGPYLTGRGDVARIPMAIRVDNIPADLEVRADAAAVTLEWPDEVWRPHAAPGVSRREQSPGGAVFDVMVQMSPPRLRQRRYVPATIRGSVYLTLFREEARREAFLDGGPANVQDGLQCRASQFLDEQRYTLSCSSFLRWPARLVYARAGASESELGNSLLSYSPLPAALDLEPFVRHFGQSIETDRVTIVTKKPLVHFRRDFEMQNVRLGDYEDMRTAPGLRR